MKRVTTEAPPPLVGVSVDLAAVCLRCLEKDPAQRYITAGDLVKDLERFLDGEPVDALAAIVGHGKRDQPQPSRFFLDPAVHAFNRGADHHFWSDQSETDVIRKLVEAVDASKEAVSNAAKGGPDGRVIRLAYHKRLMR